MKKIEIKNLIKPFNEHFNIINDVCFEFDLTKPCVILGDEGSGKTTLLNILSGLDKDYIGEVKIDGIDLRMVDLKNTNTSYVMKEPVFFDNKSVYYNLKYVFKVKGENLDKKTVMEKIKKVAEGFGIVDYLSKKIKKCNRFIKMLVSLARIELKKSQLIIIDEPFYELTLYEKTSLWQHILLLTSKLSSGIVVAENRQNIALFDDANVCGVEGGAIF